METPWRRFTPEGGLVKIWLQGSEEMTFHICKGEIVQKDVQLTLKKQFEEKMGGEMDTAGGVLLSSCFQLLGS